MLPEQRATSYAHDPALGTVVVVSEAVRPELNGDHDARLLFDEKRHLVGIDVEPTTPHRLVVMLGPHENVSLTEEVRVHVAGGGRTLTIHGAAAKLVAPGASPYVF
jgi:hypothetical protein